MSGPRRFVLGVVAVAVVVGASGAVWAPRAGAQAVRAGVLTTVEGRVTVARTAVREPVALKFRDDVFLEDRIATAEQSFARMLLGGKAVVTVRERSTFTVTEVPGLSTVALDAGKVGVAVARDRMRPGERLQIRTPNAIVAVRGTVFVVETRPVAGGGPGDVETVVHVFRDVVEATAIDVATGLPIGAAVTLAAGQTITVARGQVVVGRFGVADQTAILAGLRPREVQHREPANVAELRARLRAITADLLALLTGEGDDSLLAIQARRAAEESSDALPDVTVAPLIPSFTAEIASLPPQVPDVPDVSITGTTLILGAGETLKTFAGPSSRTLASPAIQVTDSTVAKLAPDPVVQVTSTATATLASSLLVVDPSLVDTVNPLYSIVLASVGVGASPGPIAFTPDGARAYVALNAGSVSGLAVLDATSGAQVGSVAFPAMTFVSGLTVSPAGGRAYAAVDTGQVAGVAVIDTATNVPLTIVPITCCPGSLALNPGGTRLYVADGELGQLNVVDVALAESNPAGAVIAVVPVASANRVAVAPDGARVYVTGMDEVVVLSTATNAVIGTIPVGTGPIGVAFTPDGTRAYVANSTASTLSVIDTATSAVTATIALPTGAQPSEVAVTPDGTRVYVTNFGGDSVSIVNTATQSVTATIAVGSRAEPGAVAISPDGRRIFVSQGGTESVAVIDGSPGASLLAVAPGGALRSTSTDPLVQFIASAASIGNALVELNGRPTATAPEVVDGVTLTLGTDRPLEVAGPIVDLTSSTVDARRGIVVDTALLAASAPVLTLSAGSSLTTFLAALDLVQRASVTAVGPLIRLDTGSVLTVTAGAVINVAGGSALRVTGDLFSVGTGSTLRALNGALLVASGSSVVNVSGALATFTGPGAALSVANTLCPGACPVVSGIPVLFTNGASAANVAIGPTPIRNVGLGTVSFSSNRAAAIVVDGAASRIFLIAP